MRLSRGWREAAAFVALYELYETARSHLHPPAGPSLRHALPARYGFVDSAARYGGLGPFDSGSMKDTNPFAAMPSLHIGWAVWSAWVLVPLLSWRSARLLAAVYPLVTLTAIVVTGNHWIL